MHFYDGAWHSTPEVKRGRDRRDAMNAAGDGPADDADAITEYARKELDMCPRAAERYTARELAHEQRRADRGTR